MNLDCLQARERLLDLVYGELPPAKGKELTAHLDACPVCAEELKALRFARRAMSRMLEEKPAESKLAGASLAARPRKRLAFWRLFLPGAAAAALITVPLLLFWHKTAPPPAVAENAPVEIRRTSVSLTILSQPAEGGQEPLVANAPFQQALTQRTMAIPSYAWGGLALVRDQRVIRHLPEGLSPIAFADVPAGIQPESVRLRSLDSPNGLKILEQNYQYDLASATAVLNRYIDQNVTVTFKDCEKCQPVSGVLLSFDDRTLVLRPQGQGPRNIERSQVKAIGFRKLPKGLRATPTLLWQVDNRGPAVQQFEVAYLTAGLSWRADYVLKLHPRPGKSESRNSKSETIIDTADLVGYATVTNNSGVRYDSAKLKLMAGDVNLIKPHQAWRMSVNWEVDDDLYFGLKTFAEKTFFEYHLYTLGRATTVADAETKQIELVSGSGLRMSRGYVYDPEDNPTAARVVSEFENTEANGLGKPLPKGVVRLYAPDDEGQDAFVSQVQIDHTPVKEKLRLPWGYAFDIACTTTDQREHNSGPEHSLRKVFEVRNHKAVPVTVTVLAHVPETTYKAACKQRWHVREVGLVEIELPVAANAAATATLDYSWNDVSGGGLKAPEEENSKSETRKPK